MPNTLDIDQILDELKLSSNMAGADFGTGPGHWALGLARRLVNGLVYAIDIQDSYLSALEGKAAQNYLNNLRFLQRDLTAFRGSGLPDSSLDIVVMANLLFQIEDCASVLTEAHRVLKRRGKLLVVDWRDSSPVMNRQEAVSPERAVTLTDQAGFKLIRELSLDEFHFGFIFQKL